LEALQCRGLEGAGGAYTGYVRERATPRIGRGGGHALEETRGDTVGRGTGRCGVGCGLGVCGCCEREDDGGCVHFLSFVFCRVLELKDV
jgi:hypothetical protein